MELTTLLVETIKSGKITVSQNNVKTFEIKAREKKIDVNAINKKSVNEIISSMSEGGDKLGPRVRKGVKVVREISPLLKEFAEDLFDEGVTITISYKGSKVATMGAEADSKLTRFITGTKRFEINSVAKLIEMNI